MTPFLGLIIPLISFRRVLFPLPFLPTIIQNPVFFIDKLKNLDLWIVGLLRQDTHPSHAGFDQIIDFISYIKPKQTIFTHMTALLDEKELKTKCPADVKPGYDGMIIDL